MNRNQAIRHRLEQQAESYDRRQAAAAKRAPFCADAQRYDEPREDENGKPMESPYLSDGGRGAALIRSGGERPLWEIRLTTVLESYDETDQERIEAIADNGNLADAARSLGVSRMTLYRLKTDLRNKLAPVLTARLASC